ncbi:MAG: PAS domain S-box protein, partial [Betaproteobacteria bacterium]|nr:PAS domain S-box protein [Betaproteobacteria bacterium]
MIRTWSELGIAAQISLLAAAILLPIGTLFGLHIRDTYLDAIGGASRDAFRYAGYISTQTEQFHQQSSAILQRLARRPAITALANQPCDTVFDHFLVANPRYADLLLDNPLGEVICAAAKDPNPTDRVVHSPWFRNLIATGKRQIGDPVPGKVAGQWIVAFAEPVTGQDGRVHGALLLTADLQNYQLSLERHAGDSGFLVTLIDSRGAVVARSRDAPEWVGKKFPIPSAALRSVKPGDTESIEDGRGVAQLYAHATLPGTDWLVLVSVPRDVVSTEAWEHIRFELALAAAMLILLLPAVLLIARRIQAPIREIALAAEAVGDGRLDVRFPEAGGNREMSVLAQKFNRMTELRRAAETHQAQAMTQLAASEERLQRALDASRLALWDYDLRSGEVYLSETWSELMGGPRQPTTTTFKALAALTLADDQPAIMAAMLPVVKGERQRYRIEHRLRKPDGEIIWIVSEGRIVERDANGRALRAIGTNRDITQRKRAEEALRISEANLRAMTEHASVGILINAHGYHVFSNPTIRDMLGYSADELTRSTIRDLVAPDELPNVLERNRLRMAGLASPTQYESALVSKDGRIIPVDLYATITEWNGAPANMVFVSDISARKRAEVALRESEERFRVLFEQAGVGVAQIDFRTGRVLRANRKYAEILGYEPEEIAQTNFQSVTHPDDLADAVARMKRIVAGELREYSVDKRYLRRNGTVVWGRLTVSPIWRSDEAPTQYIAVIEDITERRAAEQELRIAAIAFESQVGMMVTDARSVILRVNRSFTEMTGYSAEEAIGKTPRLLKSDHHDAAFYAAMWESIGNTGSWQGEIWDRRKNGDVFPVWLVVSAVKADDGSITHYIGSHTDITLRKSAEDKINNLAFYDALTGLPNRRLLRDRLAHVVAGSARNRRHGAIMFLDLDNFKNLNDTQGHGVGDQMLVEVAQRLKSSVRQGDTVARLGGDEFVVMLEDLDSEGPAAAKAEVVAVKIFELLNQPYRLESRLGHGTQSAIHYQGTASMGITLFGEHGESVDELLRRADLAMYRAKSAGRNTWRFFDPDMQSAISARSALETDLRAGMRENQFLLHYQAQVDSVGNLVGAEALLRWQRAGHGLMLPDDFVPLAEETGLILPLGHWVLEAACTQLVA